MNSPMLVPLSEVVDDLSGYPEAWLQSAFVVVNGGRLREREWHVGQLVVCRAPAQVGEEVVLVPRVPGTGRPRFGGVGREGLVGEAGEPCSPLRWRAAGAVSSVLDGGPRMRRAIAGWCSRHPEVFWVPPAARRLASREPAPAKEQLGLFQAA